MSKKKLLLFVAMMMIVCALIVTSNSVFAATRYYPYLNWDRNYISCDSHMGMKYYVLRDSVDIESCDESECILSIDIAKVEMESQQPPFKTHEEPIIRDVSTVYFLYDFDAEQMYVDTNDYFNDDLTTGKWYPLKYGASYAEGSTFEAAGNIAYHIVFGESFYGTANRYKHIDN